LGEVGGWPPLNLSAAAEEALKEEMIKSIRLQNFFGFQDCTINLEKGENVLVGINGSGKSNFFKAIKLLKAAYNHKLAELLIYNSDGFGGFKNILHQAIGVKESNTVSLRYTFDLIDHGAPYEIREVTYEIQIIVTNRERNEYFLLEKIWGEESGEKIEYLIRVENSIKARLGKAHELKQINPLIWEKTESFLERARNESTAVLDISWEIFAISFYENFNIDVIRKGEIPKPPLKFLTGDFSNAISFFEFLEKSEKNTKEYEAFEKITNGLRNVNDKYIALKTLRRSGEVELLLEEENLLDQQALNISDGTLRFFCLLLIFYNPFEPSTRYANKIICIDEPELGLHPDMLYTLREAIKYAAETSQIIISTHSPQLLDWFDFKNIRVFEKDEHNATIVKELDKKKFEGWYDKYMLGDMWLKGDIGGNRW
jgi:predicted ATPase